MSESVSTRALLRALGPGTLASSVERASANLVQNTYRIEEARTNVMIRNWLIRRKLLLFGILLIPVVVVALFIGITWMGGNAPRSARDIGRTEAFLTKPTCPEKTSII